MPRSSVRPRPDQPAFPPARLRLGDLLAAVALTSACAGPVTPDLVITNARVFTNDTARPWVEALAIKGERVVAVGTREAIAALTGASTRVLDVGGRVVVPGFNDARVDLPLEPPTPEGLSALDRRAIALGVTSLQIVAGGPMRSLVDAARQASRQARWRLIRSPEDTVTLSATDPTATVRHDEEPFLPPQPGLRLAANGVAWRLPEERRQRRRPAEASRVETIVGWAYGAEDPIVMAAGARVWRAALTRIGHAEVWRRKRPRFDIDGPDDPDVAADLARLGITVAWTPDAVRVAPGPGPFDSPTHYPGFYLDAGAVVCLGSGASPDPGATIAAAIGAAGRGGGRALTREEAVRAITWGSAYAEKAERDKGWLGVGTLADFAVLSDDVLTTPPERLPGLTSVLTVIGGAIVYDAGVLPRP